MDHHPETDRVEAVAPVLPADPEHTGADGVTVLSGLDVFEITATTVPANRHTRVLGTKEIDQFDRVREETRDDMLRLLDAAQGDQRSAVVGHSAEPLQIATFQC